MASWHPRRSGLRARPRFSQHRRTPPRSRQPAPPSSHRQEVAHRHIPPRRCRNLLRQDSMFLVTFSMVSAERLCAGFHKPLPRERSRFSAEYRQVRQGLGHRFNDGLGVRQVALDWILVNVRSRAGILPGTRRILEARRVPCRAPAWRQRDRTQQSVNDRTDPLRRDTGLPERGERAGPACSSSTVRQRQAFTMLGHRTRRPRPCGTV